MNPLFVGVAVILLFSIPELQCFKPSHTPPQDRIVSLCLGEDLNLDWESVFSSQESIESIKWLYRSERSQELIAMLAARQFLPLPSFFGRVSHYGNVSLVLKNVSLEDAGNYSVEVHGHRDASGLVDVTVHTAVVSVSAPPSSPTQQLELKQSPIAVYDVSTSTYHVQLTCGVLDHYSFPPVSVVWKTPSGSEESSTSEHNGTFFLQLGNPVQGGNYSCHLPTHSPAVACLPRDHPLLGESTLYVDGVTARLTLLEAKTAELTVENKRLKEEVALHVGTDTSLDRVVKELEANLTDRLDGFHKDNVQLAHALHSLEDQLNKSQPALFHAIQPVFLEDGTNTTSRSHHIRFATDITNVGGGYNITTGDFTATVSGDYFFIFTLGVNASSPSTHGDNDDDDDVVVTLRVDDLGVAFVREKSATHGVHLTGQAAVYLNPGQRVKVTITTTTTTTLHPCSSFSGFLFHS